MNKVGRVVGVGLAITCLLGSSLYAYSQENELPTAVGCPVVVSPSELKTLRDLNLLDQTIRDLAPRYRCDWVYVGGSFQTLYGARPAQGWRIEQNFYRAFEQHAKVLFERNWTPVATDEGGSQNRSSGGGDQIECNCSVRLGPCGANATVDGRDILFEVNTDQCAMVVWYADENPFITTLRGTRREWDRWQGVGASPDIRVESCTICETRRR